MKVFLVENGFVKFEYTENFINAEDANGKMPKSMEFVDAPDYVFPGWGYDENAEGSERFIKPEVGEGLVYDEKTGQIYPADSIEPQVVNINPFEDLQQGFLYMLVELSLMKLGLDGGGDI